jgi:hypothetical protein
VRSPAGSNRKTEKRHELHKFHESNKMISSLVKFV